MTNTARYGVRAAIGIAGVVFAVAGIVQGLPVLAIFGGVVAVAACYELWRASGVGTERAAASRARKPLSVLVASFITGVSLVVIGIAESEYLLVGLGGLGCLLVLWQLFQAAYRADGHQSVR